MGAAFIGTLASNSRVSATSAERLRLLGVVGGQEFANAPA
jgi:hypothetical protein